jgi:C-terminal processing protease CtpA/Prc
MKIRLLCLQLLFCAVTLGQSDLASNGFTFLSGTQIQSDLDSLSNWILDVHPAPFAHCSEQDWTERLAKNKALVSGGGNLFAAAKAYSDLTSLLKDSHTGIALQSFANALAHSNGQIPIEIATAENKTVVVQDWTNSVMPGSVVESIGGISARSLLGMSMSLISQEGEAVVSRLRMADKLWNDLVPFALGGVEGDRLPLVLSQQFQSETMVKVASKADLDSIKALCTVPDISWSSVEDHPDVIHLKIRSFNPEQLQRFKRELRNCFRSIHSWERKHGVPVEGVVLDLRQNSGGHIAVMAEVLPYLASEPTRIPFGVQIKNSQKARAQLVQPALSGSVISLGYQKNFKRLNKAIRNGDAGSMSFVAFEYPLSPQKRLNYDGAMVMLLDGLSASASVSLAAWFVRSGRGLTIGEPPMGSISGTFGNPIQMSLPASGIKMTVATARYYTEAPIRWETRPLLPDFPIAMTVEDYVFDRDPFLQRAVEFFSETP